MRIVLWKSVDAVVKWVRRLARYSETQLLRSSLKSCGRNFRLEHGSRVTYPEFISIGNDVAINSHVWFCLVPPVGNASAPHLNMGDGTYIGRFSSVACASEIVIGNDVLISDRVFITDHLHGFSDIAKPISCQPMYSPGPVIIGCGTWIGIGACVLPNVKIGRNCVIGANAVVTHDIPDYQVAVGAPARIVGRVDKCRKQ